MTFSPIAAWILTFLIHSTALFTAAFLVLRVVKGPAARVLVLRGALLGAFVTTTVAGLSTQGETWTLPVAQGSQRIISMAPGVTRPIVKQEKPALFALGESHLPKEQAATTPSLLTQAWTWLPITLGLLGVLGVIRLALRERAAWKLLARRKGITDQEFGQAAKSLLGDRSLARTLRLSSSAHINVPMALGLREVVLPEKALAELTDSQIEALLAHELAHLVRRDPLWLGASRIAVALAWLQPLLRVLMQRLEQETELAADDWAAQRIGGGLDLAVCLERVGSWLADAPTPATTAAMASSGSALVSRVERLLTERAKESRRTLFTIAATTTIALGVFACAGPSVRQETNPSNEGQTAPRSKASSKKTTDNPETEETTTPLSDSGMTYHYIADDGKWYGSDDLEDLRKTLRKNSPSGTFDETRIKALPASHFDDYRTLEITVSESPPINAGTHITIVATEPGHALTYKVNGFTMRNLEELQEYLGSNPTDSAVLHPTNGVLYADVVPVLNTAIAAGYTDVSFGGSESNYEEEWSQLFGAVDLDQPASKQVVDDRFFEGLVSCETVTVTLSSSGMITGYSLHEAHFEGDNTSALIGNLSVQMAGPETPADLAPLRGLLTAPIGGITILVHPDTPYTHVQQIMELCATREIQIWNIHVGLTSDPNFLTDCSLPADDGVLAEIEDLAEEEDREISGDKKPNLTSTADSHLVVNIQRGANEETALIMSWSPAKFSGSVDSLKGMKGVIEVNCKPDVPMGVLLAWLHRYTQGGLRLTFTASAFVGKDD